MKTPLETPLKIPPGYLNIMGYVDESEVNGPDRRSVVWVQGCFNTLYQIQSSDIMYYLLTQ